MIAHRCGHEFLSGRAETRPIEGKDVDTGELPDLSESLIKDIHAGNIPEEQIPEKLYFESARIFNEGVKAELGDYGYSDSTNALASVIRKNIYAFSASKNQTMHLELRDALLDPDGKVKPFNRFQVDAKRISGKYNKAWLNAEYNTAISSAQMGVKWREIEDAKDLYPYLIYRTVGDGRVSDEHAVLEGLKLPVDHPRWNSIMPPNRFNCRCSVDQDDSDSGITSDEDANARIGEAKIKKNFRRNSGREGLKQMEEIYDNRLIVEGGKLEQLGAVKHYGMRSLKKIYDKGKKPQIKPVKTNEEFDEWFDGQVKLNPDSKKTGFVINDKMSGRLIHVPSRIRRKMPNKQRLYANEMTNIISKPDEVWTVQIGNRIGTSYLKYYEDGIYYAVVDTEIKKNGLKLRTVMKAETFNAAENFRRGILEYKKR